MARAASAGLPFGLQGRKGWEDVGGRRVPDPDRRTGASTEARARRGLERFRWAAREAADRTRAVQRRTHREEKYSTPSGLLDGDLPVFDHDDDGSDYLWFDDEPGLDLDWSVYDDDGWSYYDGSARSAASAAATEYDLVPAWYRRAAPPASEHSDHYRGHHGNVYAFPEEPDSDPGEYAVDDWLRRGGLRSRWLSTPAARLNARDA